MADDTRVTEEQKAQLAKRRGQAAAQIVDPEERRKFISAQGDSEAVNKGELGVIKAQKLSEESTLKGYKQGTPYVPETGAAIVHKGERVIPAEKNNPMGLAEAALAHPAAKEPKKPAKKVKSVHVRRAHKGFIAENHHESPEHGMEEHALPDMDAVQQHMSDSMGGQGEPEEGASE